MLSPCPSHPKLSPSRPHPQGHFVSVYERTAPPFARESARWSADPANVQAYLDAGRRMHDVTGCTACPVLYPKGRASRGAGDDSP